MPAEKRKPEQQRAEDAEEKKRRKKEEAQAFFAKAKEKQEAKKKEREEAAARGEAPPEKTAPPPLRDIPNLAPQVRAFVTAARDAKVSGESLQALFQRVISVRQEIGAAATEVAARDDATMQMKRKAMVKVIVDRLRCVDDQMLPLACIAADPAVIALKKGLTQSMGKFISSCPESLKVVEQTNEKGNSIQYVKLEGEGPKGTGGPQGIDGSIGAQLLLSQVLETLKTLGGTSTVTKLAQNPYVLEKSKGSMTGKFSKFLSNYPDLLEISQGSDSRDMIVTLKDGAGGGEANKAAGGKAKKAALAVKGDPQEHLIEQISKYLKGKGGASPVCDLGQDALIRAASIGVAAKLSKFLAQHPTVFSITSEGEKEVMTCTLLN